MSYDWNFGILWEYRALLAQGMLMTLRIVALSVALGIGVGLALTPLRMSERRLLRWPATAVIEVFRSTPPLVLVVWTYYCLPIITGLALPAYWTCVLAISVYSGVYFAEIFRAGVQAVDRGLIEAAQSIGMPRHRILSRIVLPLAFLRIMPPFTGQCVMAIKNSVLGSYIAVGEILYEGQRLSTHTFRPMEILTFVALFFICAIMPLSLLAGRVERGVYRRYFQR
ncbi:MAG: amino acid ABC transporter permease [Rhodovulum sulfidophilum]|uniref:Amino acid ABC transporter permease n=1 Tax=Rhodovulum sulfidophilum TaxID=35806 RepID=A0A2W5NBA0_RHOSU|nr:MAG: amino acid ABC transporter permease [Rhodovulum sulfidophilum]